MRPPARAAATIGGVTVIERAGDETVDGLKIRVVHAAGAGAGSLPVVVLHGWGASLEAVAPILQGLEPAFDVLALDLPGFGASEPPSRPWSVDDYARHVLEVCDQHGLQRFSIVGHSFGARLGIAIASSHPQLVGRMVLTGAAGIKPRRKPSYYGRVAVAKTGRFVGAVGGAPGKRLQDRMRRRVASQDWLDASEAMRGTFRAVVGEDLSPRLGSIRASTLLIWGDEDLDTPLWMGRRMEDEIGDAALIVLNGGHYVYAERAAEFNRITEHFLADAR
jgi:pimeloyl-ACP methyl ester carboxylesterase